MEISLKADVESVKKQLFHLRDTGIRKAAAVALNDTAFAARRALQDEMHIVFDRPTPWTLNAPWIEKANPGRLSALVTLQGKNWRHIASAFKYLDPHIEGGPRPAKRMEALLRSRHLIDGNEYIVPSKFQRLDRFGNVPRSVVQKVLANLQASFDPLARTPSGGARGGKKKADYYFTRRGVRGQRLTAIWQRFPRGHAVPAFIVVAGAPKYKKRLRFAEVVERTIARVWPAEFERQVLSEIRK